MKSSVARWILLLIAFWSIIAVWTADPLAQQASSPNTRIYWSLVFILAVVTAVFEVRDWLRPKDDDRRRAED